MNNIHAKQQLDYAHFRRLDLNLYPLFLAIYEQRSISKAAQHLCISQSAVSHALQRLRLHFKDELFIRTGKHMQATPFAEYIYPSLMQSLSQLQHLSQLQQDFAPSMIQNIKIAIHDELEAFFLPRLVAHFQQHYPHIQFLSRSLDRKNMLADLATQQIDFVLDLKQHVAENIHFQALIEDQFVVCTQSTQISMEDYLAAPHIGVSSRSHGPLLEDVYLNRQHFSRHIFFRCQHYATALQTLALHPKAMLTVPASLLKQMPMAAHLSTLACPVELPKIVMGLYWNVDLNENMRHAFLKSEILNLFA